MPRKAKDKIDENDVIEEKKSAAKKTSTAKKSSTKKETTKKTSTKSTKKEPTKKKSTTTKTQKEPAKKSSAKAKSVKEPSKKSSTKTVKSTKETTKKSSTKTKSTEEPAKKSSTKTKSTKEPTKKSTTPRKRTTKKDAVKTAEHSPIQISEYYDLPYKYGNTVVRLLAQTPKTLFVYWEVSDSDIENFKKTYGDDFFIKTKPILVVHNTTLNKTTEIEINDFANCWYLNIEDSDCKYDIELARKFIDETSSEEASESGYLSIANSNDIQSPNNHILFEKIHEFVVFKDVNSDSTIKKNIKSFKFLKDIYKFYKDMYDEDVLNNPSSQFKF